MTSTTASENSTPSKADTKPTRNIFEDPALATAAQNDPFARWVIANWRTLLVVLVAIGAGILGWNKYTAVRLEKISAATTALTGVQDSYRQLITKDEALLALKAEERSTTDQTNLDKIRNDIASTNREIDQLRDRLTLMIDAMEPTPPYTQLKDLYRGLLASRLKDYNKVNSLLAATSWEPSASNDDASQKLVAEIVIFGLSRALIDSSDYRDIARGRLVELAERGTYTPVQALNALKLIANNDQELQRVEELSSKIRTKFPAQQKFISNDESE